MLCYNFNTDIFSSPLPKMAQNDIRLTMLQVCLMSTDTITLDEKPKPFEFYWILSSETLGCILIFWGLRHKLGEGDINKTQCKWVFSFICELNTLSQQTNFHISVWNMDVLDKNPEDFEGLYVVPRGTQEQDSLTICL